MNERAWRIALVILLFLAIACICNSIAIAQLLP